MTIKTWKARIVMPTVKPAMLFDFMQAEIDELRAELEKIKAPGAQPVSDGMVLSDSEVTKLWISAANIVPHCDHHLHFYKAMLEAAKE